MTQLAQNLDAYVKNGSAWIVEAIEKVAVVITSHRNLNSFIGHGNITIPKKLKTKCAVINLEGFPEGECFKYSILASIYRHRLVQQKQALAKKYMRFLDEVNFSNISTLTNTKEDIVKFERQNPKHVVSVFNGRKRMIRRNSLLPL